MTASTDPVPMPDKAVAIVGGGPAGLVTARYMKKHGFDPVVYEAADNIGGQWNIASPCSGVWPGMRTNTSRIMTAFSDLDHASGTSVYPNQADMHGYLLQYIDKHELNENIRLGTKVEAVEQASGKSWSVRARCGAASTIERYRRVVVATGPYTAPATPSIPGLASFTGTGGVIHSSQYRGAEAYRGQSVLVCGCSISALEIASDLASSGLARVSVAMRRQRYVIQKLLAGVPTEHLAFNRFAARAGKVLPIKQTQARLKELVVRRCGTPDQFGAFKPDEDLSVAGLTQSQHYLALVAEGRLKPRTWIERVEADMAQFQRGDTDTFDTIILATGYRLSLPFLGGSIAKKLDIEDYRIGLHDYTLHPELEGLGFIGLYRLVGAHFPVLELQARWLVYTWAGLRPMPGVESMNQGIAMAKAGRSSHQEIPMHVLADLFARNAGVEPDPSAWPSLERALWFGPLSPASFRLVGPDAEADAVGRVSAAARAFKVIEDEDFTAEEAERLRTVSQLEAARAALPA